MFFLKNGKKKDPTQEGGVFFQRRLFYYGCTFVPGPVLAPNTGNISITGELELPFGMDTEYVSKEFPGMEVLNLPFSYILKTWPGRVFAVHLMR